jgi:5-aminolevulinate synthase
MSGTRSPIDHILDLCEAYGAISVVDEVHAVGLYGDGGAGLLEELGQTGRADIITGTLGKAFGVGGGFVAARAAWIDVIRSTAPSFIFTTSLSPVMAAGALAAVRVVRRSPDERRAMRRTADYLKQAMLAAGLPLMSRETHIMPLLVGDGHKCKAMADELLERGIYVQPINFPSVPRGEELLRFTASPKHTPEHCEHLLATLVDVFAKHGLLCSHQAQQQQLQKQQQKQPEDEAQELGR